MARDDRMARVWSPGSNVAPSTIANGGISELGLAPSAALMVSQDRILRDWTVTRVVGLMQLVSAGTSQVYVGIRVANENEVAGSIDPGSDQTADWMYWAGIQVKEHATTNARNPSERLEIDNRSQRKSRGMESVLVLYTFNAGPDTVYMWWSGRTLLLVP